MPLTTFFKCDYPGCPFMVEVGPKSAAQAVDVMEAKNAEGDRFYFCTKRHMIKFFQEKELE